MFKHTSVLLKESIDSLKIEEDGIYIDATLGRAGHSKEILLSLGDNGRLICVDKDLEAIAYANELFKDDKRVIVVHSSFSELFEVIESMDLIGKVSGILFDLGVSSPQLDDSSRGFSFMRNGPLDMRMDTSQGISVADWLAKAEEKEIVKILFEYGEEKFARRIAGSILKQREISAIADTLTLAKLIKDTLPFYEKGKHPATRSFQAFRIYINDELNDLKTALNSAINILKPGGILSVISFHSLEDRIVKRMMAKGANADVPSSVPLTQSELDKLKTLKLDKRIKPSKEEVSKNVRARSAILRVATRI